MWRVQKNDYRHNENGADDRGNGADDREKMVSITDF